MSSVVPDKQPNAETLLGGYRVLDLTNERGYLCGKILGDFGADVIKIEPPGGDRGRNLGPFYKDIAHPEKSLYWFAFNTSKRGITLDIEMADGRDTFRRLVETADFVVESFEPGYMDNLGLGYSELEKINPRIIMTSITPFGSTGPYANYKASDLVLSAMGGLAYLCGEPDRPPCRISVPQSYLVGGLHGALGSMIAHYYRENTGEGQHVDVSIQQGTVYFLMNTTQVWEFNRINRGRTGPYWFVPRPEPLGQLKTRYYWRCKDGYVFFLPGGGASKGFVTSSGGLMEMAGEAGIAGELKGFDWRTYDSSQISQQEYDRIDDVLARFLLTKTKQELYEAALKRGIQIAPLNTIQDIVESEQLHARGYFTEVEHPELGVKITYPGAPLKLSECPWRISRRAPLIGEHNEEVYGEELRPTQKRHTLETAKAISDSLTEQGNKKVFAGVRVIDFSWVAAGPQVGRTLAEHGATVVRVESHRRPDFVRTFPPFIDAKPGLDRAPHGCLYNTNKYGISLDLGVTKGREIAKKLIMWADVVVESFSPSTMKRLGLDYERVREIKPGIIYCSSTMQGQYGPYSLFQGLGQHAAALAGFSALTGYPEGEPGLAHTAYIDFIAPWYTVVALVGALNRRRKTGKGMYLEQAQLEAGVTFLSQAVLDYMVNGRVASRVGNRDPDAAPHGCYPCKGEDRWVAIAVSTDEEWRAFCNVIGNPEWTRQPKFATLTGRKKNEDELDKLVGNWTTNYFPEEVMTLMQAKGVPAGVVNTTEDLFNDPQLKHREHFVYLDQKVIGNHAYLNEAIKLSKTPQKLSKAGPCLGEDNEYVYKELLGLTDDDISDLLVEGVITTDGDPLT